MKKEKRTFKGTMRSFLSSVKTFTLKALMFLARILIRIIAIISMGGMMIIPFLHKNIDYALAQWIWYPCCSVFVLLAAVYFRRKKKPVFKTPIFEFLANWGLLLVIPIFASIFVFNYYQIDDIWHWVIFAFAAAYICLFFLSLLAFNWRRAEPNEELKQRTSLNTVKYIILYWLYDLFYLSVVQEWQICTYFFGITAIVIVFYNLAKAFLNGNETLRFLLIFDFIFGVGLSVYLIYIIPEATLQNIVLTITAALYGGLLTLVGVAWTIRKGENDRQSELTRIESERSEEERKKHIPYIKVSAEKEISAAVNAYITKGLNMNNPEDRLGMADNIYYAVSIEDFNIKNISTANIILKGVRVHGKYYSFSRETIIEPKAICRVTTTNNYAVAQTELEKKVILYIGDILGNIYEVACNVTWKTDSSLNCVFTSDEGEKFDCRSYTYAVDSTGLPELIKE